MSFDDKGYLCLSDISSEKFIKKVKQSSIMGTPEYMGPEVICKDYRVEGITGKEKDWYSFGVIM